MGNTCAAYGEPKDVADQWFPEFEGQLPSMAGKVVAITGCTSGTGLVAAKTCARLGASVLLLNRDSGRATNALLEVQDAAREANKKAIEHIGCDLTNFQSVRTAVAMVHAKCGASGLDVLLENAGVMAMKDQATVDGFDVQMQTNHFSHFLLTQGLMPDLETAAKLRGEARVVIHSSIARADAKKSGLKQENLAKNSGGNLGGDGMMVRFDRYSQTKWANAVFCHALHDRLAAKGSKVKVAVAHPGIAATQLQVTTVADGGMPSCFARALVRQSAADGALGIVRAACATDIKPCGFYGPANEAFSGPAELLPADIVPQESKDLLWSKSEQACGVQFIV